MNYEIRCAEVWGGVRGQDVETESSGVRASLFSAAHDGAKGGDIYYFSHCGSDRLTRVAIADVMGHGGAVSQTSQWLYESLKARMDSIDGSPVLGDLNRLAVGYGHEAMSTAAIVTFDRQDRALLFSYAGHHPALVRRGSAGGWSPALLEESKGRANLPLGVDADAPYHQSVLPLAAGDRVFLYTDGVVEAPSENGEEYGAERLRERLTAVGGGSVAETKHGILEDLLRHTGGALSHDDVTFMTVELR